MTNEIKMTQKMALANAIEVLKDMDNMDETVEKLESMVATLEKKSSSKRTNKNAEQNEVLKGIILDVLGDFPNGATCGEIFKADENLLATSNQRVSSLLKSLIEVDNAVVKTKEKGKTIFSLV